MKFVESKWIKIEIVRTSSRQQNDQSQHLLIKMCRSRTVFVRISMHIDDICWRFLPAVQILLFSQFF